MIRKIKSDEIREREEGVEAEQRLGELLGASESGPARRQVENLPGKPLVDLLQLRRLTP